MSRWYFRTDAAGSTTYVNSYWSQISDLSFEEALGNGLRQSMKTISVNGRLESSIK
jgi:PAS domain-containing protein